MAILLSDQLHLCPNIKYGWIEGFKTYWKGFWRCSGLWL